MRTEYEQNGHPLLPRTSLISHGYAILSAFFVIVLEPQVIPN